MSYSFLASASASSTGASTGATTPVLDTTPATHITIAVAYDPGGTGITVSDSKGNTWTARTPETLPTPNSRFYDCTNPTTGTGHTFSIAGTNIYGAIAVAAFAGAASSPIDQQNHGQTVGVGTVQPGSVTPSEDNELLVTAVGVNQAGTLTINGGFTVLTQRTFVSLQSYGIGLAMLTQVAAAAANPTWTNSSGGGGMGAVIATYKAQPVAAGQSIDYSAFPKHPIQSRLLDILDSLGQ